MTPTEFRDIRKQLGLTQGQLAPFLGYSHASYVAKIERDGVPKPAMLLMRAYEEGYRPKDWVD